MSTRTTEIINEQRAMASTCTLINALAPEWTDSASLMSADAQPISSDHCWWTEDDMTTIGWGTCQWTIPEWEDVGCDDPAQEPVVWECECGEHVHADEWDDHDCYARAGEDHHARMMDR